MARLNSVAKCRRSPGKCGACGKSIRKGQPYRWFQHYRGAKQVRCGEAACLPKRAALTGSSVKSVCYAAVDTAVDTIRAATTLQDIKDAMAEAAEAVEEALDELREKLDNIENGMGHTSAPIYEELEERMNDLDSWKDSVDQWEPDDEDDETDDGLEAARNSATDALQECPE